MHYRREIDGLRALAVLPVLFFHAGFPAFRGGFVGVDVFFVISGYLITSLILADKKAGTFSLAHFYERRARRILPALFLVVAAAIPFAWAWFLPVDLKDFWQSVAAVALFSSNLLFWRESGYFDTGVEVKPLLHTWSLGVEEQFYLLFPLFLLACWKLGKRWIVALLGVLAVGSLAMAQWGAQHAPAAAFFLLPTRAWELALGALVAFRLADGAISVPALLRQALSGLGLLLLCCAVFFFDEGTPFPGLYALAPTVGAALLLLFATPATLVGRFLGTAPLVWVGLLSYSAYLWHQPLFAFARYRVFPEPSAFLRGALCALTLPLAYATWRFVETPFRQKAFGTRQRVFGVSFASSGLLLFLGSFGHLQLNREEGATRVVRQVSNQGAPSVLLLGDSHADHLFIGLQQLLGTDIEMVFAPGCIPFHDVDRSSQTFEPHFCSTRMTSALRAFEENDALRTVVLASMGPLYLLGEPFRNKNAIRVRGQKVRWESHPEMTAPWEIYEQAMRETLRRLVGRGKNVVFAIDVPELGIEPRFCDSEGKNVTLFGKSYVVRNPSSVDCSVSRAEYDARTRNYRSMVQRVAQEFPSVVLFDPTDLFCDARRCVGTYEGKRLYRDTDHLSEFGSGFVAAKLAALLADVSHREKSRR